MLDDPRRPQGIASLLWTLSERGLLTYKALPSVPWDYLCDLNARLTQRFVRFVEEEGVEVADVENKDEKH